MASRPLHFGIQTAQEGTTFEALADHWKVADALGFDSIWLDDHFYSVVRPRSESQMDGWMLLAALAPQTERIRMGLLVTCNSYRNPALLAKMAATVDQISRGRLVHGIGCGWFEQEYRGYGYDFPPIATRLAQLDESIRLQKLLWTTETPSFDGEFYSLKEAWAEPRPVQQPHPPILIGGGGERILLKLVARHAAMWNCAGTVDELRHKVGVLREHCRSEGTDFDAIEKTWFGNIVIDADEARAAARLERIAKAWGSTPEQMKARTLSGTPEAVLDRMHEYMDAGLTGFIGMFGRVEDHRATRLLGEKVLPKFR